jgi:hypothetical protein
VISGSDAANALLLSGTGSVGFTTTSSFLAVSSSQQQISSSLLQVSASYISLSGSYTTFSGSASTRITANSSSIQQVSASQQQISSSQQQISSSLLNVISVFATTGSNSFRANQSITGSLVVSSTITAQTLVVQTVTSSIVYSSGSNIFGSALGDRQSFTGSLNVTGSSHSIFGNVGIGLNNPTNRLEVQSGDIKLNSGASRCTNIFFGITGTNYGKIQYSDIDGSMLITTIGSGAGYDLNLGTQCTTRLTILGDGKVGIGTATPLSTFHVNCCIAGGATATVARFGVQDSTGYGTTSPAIELTGTNVGLCFTMGKIAGINDVSSGGSMAFSTGLCAGTVLERMRITSTGVACFACQVCAPSFIGAALTIATSLTGVGRAVLNSGDATHSGYINWYNSSVSRLGYMGYNNTDIELTLEGTSTFKVTGGATCFACSVRVNSGGITLPNDGNNIDVGGVLIVRGNGSACNTHYLTTGAANVAKYIQYNASGTAINQINAGGDNYITGGNVGIGINSPQGLLDVYKSTTGGLGGHIMLRNNGAAVGNEMAVMFVDGDATTMRAAISSTTENSPYYGDIKFKTGIGTYSCLTTRMTINGAGSVMLNTTCAAFGRRLTVSSDIVAYYSDAENMTMGISAGTGAQSWGIQVCDTGDGSSAMHLNARGGPVGINIGSGNNASYPLHVNGTAYATGAAGALSDIRRKQCIQPLSKGLAEVMRLNPVEFAWKDEYVNDCGMLGVQLGFIAQEVQEILPTNILTDRLNNNTLALKYNEYIPILTKAIQEQQCKIALLESCLGIA